MALVFVQEDGGGDYTTLAAAVSANEVDIEIQETWSAVEAANITIDDNTTTITCTGSAKHPGHDNDNGTPTHFRITDSSGGHVFTISATPVTLDGLDIKQTGSGASDECIRMSNDGGTLTVKNCLLHSAHLANGQDGIHVAGISCTINLENCFVYSFERAGIAEGGVSGAGYTTTFNVNSCGFYLCGEDGITLGGAIGLLRGRTATFNVNVHNSWALDCNFNQHDDYNESGTEGTAVWGISYSIDSDNSIAGRDGGGAGNQASRAIAESDQGAGSFVIVMDITGNIDLRLRDISNANNNAQDEHTTDTAEGLTIPGTDIVGTSRPQNTNHDVGAFEVAVVAGVTPSPRTGILGPLFGPLAGPVG